MNGELKPEQNGARERLLSKLDETKRPQRKKERKMEGPADHRF
jgi:hypothetical protein